jgi:hypothetical protein
MKTDYQKYLIGFSMMLLITWTLSCSGRSGKLKEPGCQPVPVVSGEVPSKLIKIISPEENSGFKLNQPVKVIYGSRNKKSVPDSVTVYFNGNFVTTVKSEPWEYSIPSSFTVTVQVENH